MNEEEGVTGQKPYPEHYSEEKVKELSGEEVYSYQLDLYGNNVYLEKVKGGYILKQTHTLFPSTTIENIIPIPEEGMRQICQLEKDEPKPSEDGLLDNDVRCDMFDAVLELHPNISTKIQSTISNLIDEVAKAQRDLTASIKDAEIAQLNQKLAIDYIIDLIKRARHDFLGLPDGEQEFIGKLAKELWDIKKIDAECQERAKRMIKKIETHYQGNHACLDNDWWQTLKKEEGL